MPHHTKEPPSIRPVKGAKHNLTEPARRHAAGEHKPALAARPTEPAAAAPEPAAAAAAPIEPTATETIENPT